MCKYSAISVCGVMGYPKKILELAHDVLNAKGYHPARMTDQAKCIGCAMCAMMCPDCVIKVEKE